jgi:hypothetical protein
MAGAIEEFVSKSSAASANTGLWLFTNLVGSHFGRDSVGVRYTFRKWYYRQFYSGHRRHGRNVSLSLDLIIRDWRQADRADGCAYRVFRKSRSTTDEPPAA